MKKIKLFMKNKELILSLFQELVLIMSEDI